MNSSDGIATDPLRSEDSVTELLVRRIRGALLDAPLSTGGIVQVSAASGHVDVMDWLEAQQAEEKIFWEDRDKQLCVAGIGVAHTVRIDESLALGDVSARIRRAMLEGSVPGARIRYYGGICFNPQEEASSYWKPFGAARFVLPRFELRQEDGATRLLCNLIPEEDKSQVEELIGAAEELAWPAPIHRNGQYTPASRTDVPDRSGWQENVEAVLGLLRGEYGKVVLARESAYAFDQPLHTTALFRAVREATPGAFHFLIQPKAGTAFVGASPERLFSKRGSSILSEAIAGTRPRGKDAAEDRRFRQALLASDKDQREHAFVRESLYSGLQTLCNRLQIDDGVSELELPRSWHLITRLKGSLRDSATSLNVLTALHPTPAVGGWPTEWALERIEEVEDFDRGWYAGPVGWLGAEDAEFAVAIRSGLVEGSTLRLYSGAGIVEGSDPHVEWNEIEQKISDFIDALGLDS